jgi:hypothetical protein
MQSNKKIKLPEALAICQKVFNEFIRLRDQKDGFFTCISCQVSKPIAQMNAGHYWSVGGHTAVRFDEDNCHGQCIACNKFKHGNLINYTLNLIKKIGQARYDKLEQKRFNKSKMMVFEVQLLTDLYREKVKTLKNNFG